MTVSCEQVNLKIRQATFEDAPLLAALNKPVQQIHTDERPELFKPPHVMEDMLQFNTDRLATPDHYFFIGEVEGKPVGYVYAIVVRRPENPFTYAMDFVVIDQISVSPECRSKGYGEALTQYVFEFAKAQGIHRVTLNVWSFNQRAITFYERQGFREFTRWMEITLE